MTALVSLLRFSVMTLWVLLLSAQLFSCREGKTFQQLKNQPQEVKPIYPQINLEVNYCPRPSENIDAVNFYTFVLDYSYSNYGRNNDTCVGTDPQNQRLVAVENFFKNRTQRKNEKSYFSIILFGSKSLPECYRLFNNRTSYFTDNFDDVKKVIELIRQDHNSATGFIPESCKNWTNYLEGLNALTEVKKNFIQSMQKQYHQGQEKSAIVYLSANFVSDGAPVVLASDNLSKYTQPTDQVLGQVLNYINLYNYTEESRLAAIHTSLNTIYYSKPYTTKEGANSACVPPSGDPDKEATDLLTKMAKLGKGTFYNLKNRTPNFDDLNIPSLVFNFFTKQLFAINLSAVWREKAGQIFYQKDRDLDGLSDEQEIELGSDPTAADSDNDGFSDFTEWRLYQQPQFAQTKLSSCDLNNELDTDLDLLSDCDEILIGLPEAASDSDQDGIIDGLQWRFGLSIGLQTSTDLDRDGLSNLEELQRNLPPQFRNDLIEPKMPEQFSNYRSIRVSPQFPDQYNTAQLQCSQVQINQFRLLNVTDEFTLGLFYYGPQEVGPMKQLVRYRSQLKPNTDYCFRDEAIAPEQYPAHCRELNSVDFQREVYYESAIP